jgi:hypothetical protein
MVVRRREVRTVGVRRRSTPETIEALVVLRDVVVEV